MPNPSWDSIAGLVFSAIDDQDRLTHVWGVVETCLALADAHRADLDRAAWAALLHDSAKCMPRNEQEALLREQRLIEDEADWATPATWHALVGAWIAREQHGVDDPSVLNAIRYHPTGAPGMDDLGLIVFIADYCEPARGYAGSRELRQRALKADLVSTALEVCRNKVAHVRSKGRTVHPRSLLALQDLETRAAMPRMQGGPE